MSASRQDILAQYRDLKASGIARVRSGDHKGALGDLEEARRLASLLSDPEVRNEATANLAMVWLALGEESKAESGLREILLNSRDPRVLFGAAYNLAVSQRKRGRYERARFYALKAMTHARQTRRASNRAGCHNLLGNILMNQGHLEEALAEYRQALRIRRRQSGDVRFSISILLENIGYTYLLKKQFRRGVAMIRRALELATAVGALRGVAECYQDICYATLRMGQFAEASAYGRKALALARAQDYRDVEKNCYYLLGEAAHLDGRRAERDQNFEQLQALHPEVPFLRDFLCSFDLRDVITLKR